MSVCGIIPISLWEKFGELSIVLDNSRQFVGKKNSVNKSTVLDNSRQFVGINYWIIYVYLPRYLVSQRPFDGKFAKT